mmetsp:Transcript_891/g.2898  ORF Transcript_891/g.2898 Transcript_891/m.2898 type:complete len:224 (-) Transcript_891:350-1021(-)
MRRAGGKHRLFLHEPDRRHEDQTADRSRFQPHGQPYRCLGVGSNPRETTGSLESTARASPGRGVQFHVEFAEVLCLPRHGACAGTGARRTDRRRCGCRCSIALCCIACPEPGRCPPLEIDTSCIRAAFDPCHGASSPGRFGVHGPVRGIPNHPRTLQYCCWRVRRLPMESPRHGRAGRCCSRSVLCSGHRGVQPFRRGCHPALRSNLEVHLRTNRLFLEHLVQ